MVIKKRLGLNLKKAALGVFFVLAGFLAGLGNAVFGTEVVQAVPVDNETTETEVTTEETTEITETTEGGQTGAQNDENSPKTDTCYDSLGAIGWLVCPVTGTIAEAVDWLYEKLEGIMAINPVKAEDGSPIYEIWKWCLSLTNIVFVIFMLVVIYSQITGVGISNYGVKRALPKLIVAAILVNLSFLICSLAVDVSNAIGMGIRGVFEAVETSVAESSGMSMHLGLLESLGALVGGGAIAVGAALIAFETGAIWMLIPVVLGAIVAVVTGLITIAMRQAVVILLIMVAPLAIVANILPNTEQWFTKWKQLFFRMLVFYPLFSLLFGASQLAGFAIMMSATDGFGLLLGVAVQTFPLFFSWSLMKMSGTFLETINTKLRGIGMRPVGALRGEMEKQKMLSKQKHLAGRAYTPSLRLMQFMSNRRVARDADLSAHQETVKNRGLAYRAQRNYKRSGAPSRRGERQYREAIDNMGYQRQILRDKNNYNKGLGGFAVAAGAGQRQQARLKALDQANMNASDYLKAEQARGEKIDYNNAMSFHERMQKTMNVHTDLEYGFATGTDENGNEVKVAKTDYKFHMEPEKLAASAEAARYQALSKIMDNQEDVQYLAATAAQGYDTQRKIVETKMQKYFDLTVPTKEVELRLDELTKAPSAISNIDSIIAGLRVLNQRGDMDILRIQMENVLDHGVNLGTHASQALGNFLMFEVGDRDPFLRRFGKYINLETAQVYNQNRRTKMDVDLTEFVTGEFQQRNPETGELEIRQARMGLPVLMLGTPLDKFERKAMQNLEDMLIHTYTDENGRLDVRKYLAQREAVQEAMAPQFISASLKYLSGSDQIKTLVSFLTGYDGDGKARWEPGGDLAADAKYAEKHFREKTLKYLNDQTPSNLLGLRSDYHEPLMEHLSREYAASDIEKWDDDARAEYREYMQQLAEIQTRYGDATLEQTMERREADVKELKNKMAGAEFRQLLDSKGKLEQIYRTRRSGAANNAKDWVRKWLNLDDEIAISKRLKQINERNRKDHVEQEERAEADAPERPEVYNEAERENLVTELERLWDNLNTGLGVDSEEYYNEAVDYLQRQLGDVGALIRSKFKEYHEAYPGAEAEELKDVLEAMVRDADNY